MTIDTRRVVRVVDDFCGCHIDTSGTTVQAGRIWRYGGTSIIDPVEVASDPGAPGLVNLIAGATSGFVRWVSAGGGATDLVMDLGDVSYFKVRLRTDATSSIRVTAGLGVNVSSANFGTAGVFFRYDSTVGANWRSVTRSASAETASDTGIPISTSVFKSFEWIQVSPGVWHAYATTDGPANYARVHVATHSTNVPSGGMAFGVQVETLTGANRAALVDLLELESRELTLR